jgi:hypothetical protein
MPVIPILLSDNAATVDYKVRLAGQVSDIENEIADLVLRRRYYGGDHDLLLNNDQKAFLDNIISKNGRHPIDNKTAVAVDKLRRRINVQGFAMPNEQATEEQTTAAVATTPTTAAEWVQQWWNDNKMDALERDLYQHALVDEYAFVSAEPKSATDGTPVFHIQKRWDGDSGMRIFWEQDSINRNPLYAVKYWYTRDPLNLDANNLKRITLYTKNAIYKWIQLTNPDKQAKYFNLLEKEDDDTNLYQIQDNVGDPFPIPWVDSKGEPLGLAVVPFVIPMGNIVDRVMGLQDALNKTWLDIIATADQQGFGVYWAGYTGQVPNVNISTTGGASGATTTSDDGYGIRPGSVIEMPNNATLNKLAADDMTGLHNTIRLIVTAIAANSEMPLHYFIPLSGEVPSGAALDELSKSVAEQADEITVAFSPAWSEVMTLAQKISKEWNGGYKGEAVRLTPKWKPQPKSPETEANAFNPMVQLTNAIAALSGLGVSVEGAARFLGCSEEQIKSLADTGMIEPPAQ